MPRIPLRYFYIDLEICVGTFKVTTYLDKDGCAAGNSRVVELELKSKKSDSRDRFRR